MILLLGKIRDTRFSCSSLSAHGITASVIRVLVATHAANCAGRVRASYCQEGYRFCFSKRSCHSCKSKYEKSLCLQGRKASSRRTLHPLQLRRSPLPSLTPKSVPAEQGSATLERSAKRGAPFTQTTQKPFSTSLPKPTLSAGTISCVTIWPFWRRPQTSEFQPGSSTRCPCPPCSFPNVPTTPC